MNKDQSEKNCLYFLNNILLSLILRAKMLDRAILENIETWIERGKDRERDSRELKREVKEKRSIYISKVEIY